MPRRYERDLVRGDVSAATIVSANMTTIAANKHFECGEMFGTTDIVTHTERKRLANVAL